MKFSILTYLTATIVVVTLQLLAGTVVADEDAEFKVVLQVSTDDKRTQTIALNNAVNLQKHYGPENIEIEIVAYGPGLGLLTTNSKMATRVASLALSDIKFSACANTMTKFQKKTGQEPVLVNGVKIVPAGVSRIIELQKKGYAYIKP